MLFQLDEPEMIKEEEIVLPPQESEEPEENEEVSEIVIKKRMLISLKNGRIPLEGRQLLFPIYEFSRSGITRKIGTCYALPGNWAVTIH